MKHETGIILFLNRASVSNDSEMHNSTSVAPGKCLPSTLRCRRML